MQKTFLLLLAFLPFLSFVKKEKEEFIDWDAGQRLTWADFKGKPSGARDEAANTNTHMGFDIGMKNNTITYKITCRFSKTKSWVRTKTDYILQHEQGHFDIAEIFARQLYKDVKEYVDKGGKNPEKLSHLYQQTMEEKIQMQTDYDAETNHSINKEEQKKWLQKIDTRLSELNAYADY